MTGISNGGMMAYAMASEASDTCGRHLVHLQDRWELPTIHPSRPVPTLEFHSLDDPIAKWGRRPQRQTPGSRLSVMEGIDQWVKASNTGGGGGCPCRLRRF